MNRKIILTLFILSTSLMAQVGGTYYIRETNQLWNLDIRDLTLFARLDIYGDDETKKFVKEKIVRALYKEP